MVENYKQLYLMLQETIKEVFDKTGEACEFQLASNGSCQVEHKASTKRLVFMMAKLGDEQKVGFAYFAANEKQPDWIDDLPAGQFTKERAQQLIEEALLSDSSDKPYDY